MSDIQDPLVVLQHRMQQRQILALMGINQWVQPSSGTINIADISAPNVADSIIQPVSSSISVEQPHMAKPSIDNTNGHMSNVTSEDFGSALVDEDSYSTYYHDDNDAGLSRPHEQSPVIYSFDTSTPDTATTSRVEPAVPQATAVESIDPPDRGHDTNNLKIAPFDLQGGRYGDWVFFVDIQALNNDSQKLWQNITQALSITCETTSFPICEGMDTAELANASLAGYVFKIGRSEEIQVAALTALPEGLEHPNMTTVPTLDEMLADSSLKRQFWETLSH
ncbi:hypothetical protein [Psychrobacter namhaensis]|uniref:hypothetical protein n=1 Tax=Psychrobacter namhaensis TaxID=292734 RepID=UPI0018DF9210|nr:hypothetical protein [Psychrobacter namhaensis]